MSPEDRTEDAVIVECDLDEPPGKVWRALTVPDLLAAWLMPNDFRPEVGRSFTFRGDPGAAEPEAVRCEVLAVEPERLVRYSWSEAGGDRPAEDTVVTFTLSETRAGGTRLRVVHSGAAMAFGRPVARLSALLGTSPFLRGRRTVPTAVASLRRAA